MLQCSPSYVVVSQLSGPCHRFCVEILTSHSPARQHLSAALIGAKWPCLTAPASSCRPASLPVVADLWSLEERGGGLHEHMLFCRLATLPSCLSASSKPTSQMHCGWSVAANVSPSFTAAILCLESLPTPAHNSEHDQGNLQHRRVLRVQQCKQTHPHLNCCCCVVHVPGSREKGAAFKGDSGWAGC